MVKWIGCSWRTTNKTKREDKLHNLWSLLWKLYDLSSLKKSHFVDITLLKSGLRLFPFNNKSNGKPKGVSLLVCKGIHLVDRSSSSVTKMSCLSQLLLSWVKMNGRSWKRLMKERDSHKYSLFNHQQQVSLAQGVSLIHSSLEFIVSRTAAWKEVTKIKEEAKWWSG